VPPVPFNNPIFIDNFQQPFFAVSMSLNPNAHFINDDITPNWPEWRPSGGQIMLFNRTDTTQQSVVKLIGPDDALATRCACVHVSVHLKCMPYLTVFIDSGIL
jgi:hypothetical protein